jgi:HD-GYP domain-containing protein (c-di-GMP phosphodiesterase class II)
LLRRSQIDPLIFEKAVKLHDIGKIAVGDSILKKPGKLTQEEFNEMQKHTLYGVEIIEQTAKTNSLENDPIVTMGIEIAKHHHENWDGSGYPHGLAYKMFADNIPLESRIMSIIDVYDALRSPRVYKEPCSHQDTLRIMTEMSGKKFDPNLFELFIQISDEFDAIYNQHKD